MMLPTWRCATHQGDREENQDTHAARHGTGTAPGPNAPVAVVCDGLGGERGGQIASKAGLAGFLLRWQQDNGEETPAERLRAATEAANDEVGERGFGHPELDGMGTTLVAATLSDGGLEWISVGDSPLYLVRGDGNTVEALNPRHNPRGRPNVLTSALTGVPIPLIAASERPVELGPGDTIVLASDGIDTLGETAVGGIVSGAGTRTRTLARDLVAATIACEARRQDNVTVVAARMPSVGDEQDDGVVTGRRVDGEGRVEIDGAPLDWEASLAVRNHSPTGPEWGYGGSGPAQLALAILLAVIEPERAERLYQAFKTERIATIGDDEWSLAISEVKAWVREAERGETARP